MKVLLLGGTGPMGLHLSKLLSDDGVDTLVTSRRERSSQGSVRYIKGNAHELPFLDSLLKERWDVIVDFMVYSTPDMGDRMQALLSATDQYVYLSSARVYANSSQLMSEDSPRLLEASEDKEYLATDEYALAKARQEDLLRNSGRDNWTIIRPYITYGEKRLQLGVLEKEEWLYRALKGRTIVFSSAIAERVTTLTYGLNVAEGMRAIIGAPGALGKAFHVTCDKSITWQEAMTIYLAVLERHMGFKPKVLMTDLACFEQVHTGRYQIHYDRLFNRRFDNKSIAGYVETNRFLPPEKGLAQCLESFLQNPDFDYINWRAEAIKDRITRERTPLREISSLKQKVKYLLFRYLYNPRHR